MRTDSVLGVSDVSSRLSSLAVTQLDEPSKRRRLARIEFGADRRRQGGSVEYSSRLVAHFLKHSPDGAIVLGDALFAGRIGRLTDAGDQSKRAVQGSDHFPDADAIRRSAELIAAVGSLAAFDKTAAFHLQENAFEEFLRHSVVVGELANQDWAPLVLACELQHRFQAVFGFSRQHLGRNPI
jgi:hypothetical protein